MKEKIEELLNKRIEFILQKDFENITNEEFNILESALIKINNKESEEEYKKKNKDLVDLISKMFN